MKRVVQDAEHVVRRLDVTHSSSPTYGGHDVRTAAHRLSATTDGNLGLAHDERLRGTDNRLKSRSAQAVDVEGWRLLRDAGLDRGDAGEVGIARLGGNDVAHHHMTDARGLDAAARDRFTHGGGRQLRHRDVFERATEGADGRSRRGDDKDLTSSHAISCG